MTNNEIPKNDNTDTPNRKVYYIDLRDLTPDQAVAELENLNQILRATHDRTII